MNKDIVVVGAGGFGKEVIWLIERINSVVPKWNLLGFIDDNLALKNKIINGYKVLGTTEWLKNYKNEICVVCAIAIPAIRKGIIRELSFNGKIRFAILIDPSVIISNYVSIGEGSIICAGTIITVNIEIGKHVIIDVDCTIGHDTVIKDFVMLYPSVNVSGNVLVNENIEIGTGTQIKQGIEISTNIIIGAGAVVVNNLLEQGTYIGIPAKNIKNNAIG